jgi:hypothetical protein
MRLNKLMLFSLFLSIGMFTFIGCRKKKDTSAEITVRNSSGSAVANAQVVLYPVGSQQGSVINSDIYDTAYTNQEGVARFNFNEVYQLGQAGVVVLNIRAKSGASVGDGIIKIEEEVETKETVYL